MELEILEVALVSTTIIIFDAGLIALAIGKPSLKDSSIDIGDFA
jgi:hypothetical protein